MLTQRQKSNKYQVTDIQYEYSYVPLSSSKREGEDNTSDFDRFEATTVKADELIIGSIIWRHIIANLSNCWDSLRALLIEIG